MTLKDLPGREVVAAGLIFGGEPMTLNGTGRAYGAWLTQRHYAPTTVRIYVAYVQRAERTLGCLEHVDADRLYDWWTTLPQSAASRNGAKKALVVYYRSLGARRGGPAEELPSIPEPERLPRPVAGSVFARLRVAAGELGGVHAVIGALLGTTGCRISEARLARWDAFCLDGDQSSWTISGKGSGRRGAKPRTVPLHPSVVTVLSRWRGECGSRVFVFPSPQAGCAVIADSTFRGRVYEIVEHAGLDEHVNPHRWRHTVATAALHTTHDLAAVQDLLGHADPATTRRYTEVVSGRLRCAVDAAATYGDARLSFDAPFV
jgi:integrase